MSGAAPASGWASAFYAGVVTHARFRPAVHRLRYRIFMMLLDLDELPALSGALRLFSYNRAGLLSFHDKDHLDGSGPLRPQIERALLKADIDLQGGAIRVLCMPRMLGFVFNPISVYFCHRRSGQLAALIYEVNNTFGQRHSYLIPVRSGVAHEIEQTCDKQLFVSPFLDMAMRYRFRVRPPGEEIAVLIDAADEAGPLVTTAFRGKHAALTDRAVLSAVARHPLMTATVVAAIHWEAVKLLFKGVGLTRRPPAPEEPVTVVR
jgi:DUF1365 family protein